LQRRWQDGCRIWPLLARGFGHTLYVVPGGFCTTARWTCQALIHVRAKLHSAYAPHVPKEQTLAAQEAPARIIRWCACRPPSWHATRRRAAARTVSPTSPTGPGPAQGCRRPRAHCAAAPSWPTRPATGWSAPSARCDHPHGAGALFPFGPPADRDHGRLHVRAPDRRLDRPARFAPGVTFVSGAGFPACARKPFA